MDGAELGRQVTVARTKGWADVCGKVEKANGLPAGLLLAIASRETDMHDIVGDGGHGRGLFQIDDRAHGDWLRQKGCAAAGKTPPIEAAAAYAAALLVANRDFGRQNGVPDADLLRFSVSAYNAGAGGALAGYREGDPDRRTTGHDYGRDVLDRLHMMGNGASAGAGKARTAAKGGGDIMRKGSKGPRVAALKQQLEAWFTASAPAEWAAFGVAPGPAFGDGLDRAVRAFQGHCKLLVDGEVGPQTLAAITSPAKAKAKAPAGPAKAAAAKPKRAAAPGGTGKRLAGTGDTGAVVRDVQGWLSLQGYAVAVDGEFGAATAAALRRFQTKRGLPPNGQVDQATLDALTAPLRGALAALKPRTPLGALVIAVARQHLRYKPREVGGANAGPWVRLYTDGKEGTAYPWCAAFATYCLEQACTTAGVAMPIPRTLACDAMASAAGSRLITGSPSGAQRKAMSGGFFLRVAKPGSGMRYAHTGIVVAAGPDTFSTIEGNTNDDGSAEGYEVIGRTRGYADMHFVTI